MSPRSASGGRDSYGPVSCVLLLICSLLLVTLQHFNRRGRARGMGPPWNVLHVPARNSKLCFAAIWNAARSPYRACRSVWYPRVITLLITFPHRSILLHLVQCNFLSGWIPFGVSLSVVRFEDFSRIVKENFKRQILGCRKCKWNIIVIGCEQLCLQSFFFMFGTFIGFAWSELMLRFL